MMFLYALWTAPTISFLFSPCHSSNSKLINGRINSRKQEKVKWKGRKEKKEEQSWRQRIRNGNF